MGEYIDRKVAVKIAEKYGLANGSALGRHTGLADCIASEIAALPAADVAPVEHGKWIESANFDTGFWVCSKCGFVSEAIAAPKLYNYCPNCGKKMDGGADNG